MRVTILASGSSGNATLVEAAGYRLLIDAGGRGTALVRALERRGVEALDLVLLTHEHHDHVSALEAVVRRYGATVVANQATLRAAGCAYLKRQVLPTGGQLRLAELTVTSFAVPHDGLDPVGFWLEEGGNSLCSLVDLGHVPEELRGYLAAADLVILEANHDPDSLWAGPYPAFLKARIGGYNGHLSNQQAARAVVEAATGRRQQLWLAHLSAVNNTPTRARQAVEHELRQAGIGGVTVRVALRDRPSLTWDSDSLLGQTRLHLWPSPPPTL